MRTSAPGCRWEAGWSARRAGGLGDLEYGQDYQLGYSLGGLRTEELDFEVAVDAQRRDSQVFIGREADGVDQSVLGRATVRW